MKLKLLSACLLVVLASAAMAQVTGDVLGMHNLAPGGTSPIQAPGSLGCTFCHAPHSSLGGITPLWNQTLSTATYTFYSSTTMVNTTKQPTLGTDSTLCLSCHDGTVAVGNMVAYGNIQSRMTGQMNPTDVLGTNLQADHPFSFNLPLQPASDLWPSLSATPPTTADTTKAVRLIKGNVECTSCHNPHVQNIDPNSNFLVINNSNGTLCLACHTTSSLGLEVARTMQAGVGTRITPRTVTRKVNPLEEWNTSVHATASNKVALQVSTEAYTASGKRVARQTSIGSYSTVARNGCLSCHQSHQAPSPKSLLRGSDDQACIACHSGGSNISPAAPDISSEIATPKISHSFPSLGTNSHQAGENALLDQNRHATCADCHNSHSSKRVTTFTAAPTLRPSQNRVVGISATDGVTVLSPAVNQYENCLRCHGASTGKQALASFGYLPARAVSAGDPLNLIPQFSINATSSHPVTNNHMSGLPQPSLLAFMLNLDGVTKGRAMGTQIFCTDCHNSDDNRESGGNGPNGPHGSKWTHILERRYEFSQAPGPGQLVKNLFPNPDTSVNGPYALCGKCHDLRNILSNTSFKQHAAHIGAGFSCSACHTAHGIGATNGNVTGERLVNFDVNVVGANGPTPISYNRNTNTCALTCHGVAHGANGTVSQHRASSPGLGSAVNTGIHGRSK